MSARTPDRSNEPDAPPARLFQSSESPVRRRWPWILVAVVVAAAALLFAAQKGPGATKAAAGGGRSPSAVPVVLATAKSGDVGVYLNGLGTATPLATVTVRSRVDGQIDQIAFKEGELVHAGDLLAEIDPRPFQVQLQQAEGQLAKDEVAVANAKVDLERYRVLIEQDSVSKQQLDTQQATVRQLEAALESDRAQVGSAKLNLTYSRITSPITGRVGLRLADPGNIVHANDPAGIVVVTELKPITVVFSLAADHLPRVLEAMRGSKRLVVEAWDRDLAKKLSTGTLAAIDNQIDPATGTVRLRANFDNDDEALFPNQFVNARLLVETIANAIVVPAAAIQHSPQATFVWLVAADDTVTPKNVDVRQLEGDQAAIGSGLAAGDRVVIDGVDKLQPGARISTGTRDPKGGAGGTR